MKTLLLLTNLANGDSEEDLFLKSQLEKEYKVTVAHPLECLEGVPAVDGILIRNTWPGYEYQENLKNVEKALLASGIKTYNPLTGKGDNVGKDYLIDLWQKDYPVIPSIDNLGDLDKLPACEYFFIKQKHSCDGVGSVKLTKAELGKINLDDYIIQPFLEFNSEPSFFFVDNQFAYATDTDNRLTGEDEKVHFPQNEELVFAQKFVDWNAMSYGLQRIDAIRTKTGDLLLTEVEDICPFLYLLGLDESTRASFLKTFFESISKNLFS